MASVYQQAVAARAAFEQEHGEPPVHYSFSPAGWNAAQVEETGDTDNIKTDANDRNTYLGVLIVIDHDQAADVVALAE